MEPGSHRLPGRSHQRRDNRAEQTWIALLSALQPARLERQEKLPVGPKDVHSPGGPVQRAEQQRDPHDDQRDWCHARAGEFDSAGQDASHRVPDEVLSRGYPR